MEKVFIKNRKGQKIVVLVEKTLNQKGLAFVMHGLGGSKDELHIQIFAQAFKDNGFTVIRFDTTNTFGESDGKYEDATVTNYYEDLEDLINWSKNQAWYQEPFYLAGHSLGGISVILYAQKYPEKIKGLAPISTVVSGELSLDTPLYRSTVSDWRQSGWITKKSESDPNRIKMLPWSHIEDRLKYNVLSGASSLIMPVLMVVGDLDESTPPEHQRLLFEKLPGEKELHIIKGSKHVFINPEHLQQIKQIFNNWIDAVEA